MACKLPCINDLDAQIHLAIEDVAAMLTHAKNGVGLHLSAWRIAFKTHPTFFCSVPRELKTQEVCDAAVAVDVFNFRYVPERHRTDDGESSFLRAKAARLNAPSVDVPPVASVPSLALKRLPTMTRAPPRRRRRPQLRTTSSKVTKMSRARARARRRRRRTRAAKTATPTRIGGLRATSQRRARSQRMTYPPRTTGDVRARSTNVLPHLRPSVALCCTSLPPCRSRR